jgi:hypothetical protein
MRSIPNEGKSSSVQRTIRMLCRTQELFFLQFGKRVATTLANEKLHDATYLSGHGSGSQSREDKDNSHVRRLGNRLGIEQLRYGKKCNQQIRVLVLGEKAYDRTCFG